MRSIQAIFCFAALTATVALPLEASAEREDLRGIINVLSRRAKERRDQGDPSFLSRTITTADYPVVDIAWSGDGRYIAGTSGASPKLRVWDAKTGTVFADLDRKTASWEIAFSRDGRFLASGNWHREEKTNVRVWDVASQRVVADLSALFPDETLRSPQRLVFTPDSRHLVAQFASFGEGGQILVFSTESWQPIMKLGEPGRHKERPKWPSRDPVPVDISWDGRFLVYGAGWNPTMLFGYDLRSGHLAKAMVVEGMRPSRAVFSPSGREVAVGGSTGSLGTGVRIFDWETGQMAREIRTRHTELDLSDVAYSPDGRIIATASEDATIELHDATTGSLLHTLGDRNGPVYGLAFSPDGTHLASAGDRVINLWDIAPLYPRDRRD